MAAANCASLPTDLPSESIDMSKSPILDTITSPHQLRRLSEEQMVRLAEEIRQRIIEVVSRRGGHLASNLGVAELTIALHHVFDFSQDKLLWDVGHQCYAHKLITGRAGRFETLRQSGGLSGFPAPHESEYDLLACGHAGTAISTAAGLAWADRRQKSRVVAVVGDGSIVNGLSMEGIDNAAMLQRQFLIVLNDNSMAIDRTSGALARALDRLRMSQKYTGMKQSAEHLIKNLPGGEGLHRSLRNLRDGLRATLHGGRIFESLGLIYFGPVDGHNLRQLISVLQRLATLNRPAILHVHTEKGRGAQYAVEDPCRFHSPSAYTVTDGKAVFKPTAPTWTEVFSEALVALAQKNDKIVAITAAMPDGTGLVKFRQTFPDRYIDVGINESHAVAMAGGMAKAGLRPVVAIYSTFMQRATDQVFQEAALQKLPVILCMDRAGLVGSDGAVHHGFMDIAMLRALPGVALMAPADAAEMSAALELAATLEGPSAIRYPRDEVPADLPGDCPPFELGKARPMREGKDATLLCYGVTVEPAMEAAAELDKLGVSVGVLSARFAKPLDVTAISRVISSARPVLIIEDHATIGGFGSAVMEMAAARGLNASRVRLLGLPDRFIAHASRQEQLNEAGLDAPSIAAMVQDMLAHSLPDSLPQIKTGDQRIANR